MERELQEKLARTCYMQVYSYLLRLTGERELAGELTQETFLRAYSTTAVHRGEADPATWLCAIGKRLFADELRRRSRLQPLPETLPDPTDMPGELSDREQSFRIHKALHGLREPYREVFEQRVFGELSFRQIGTICGKTESWARVTYHRARLMIQERMGNDESGM